MKPRVVVVGLGPGGEDLLTEGTRAAIARIPVRFVRTERHPSAAAVGEATSFDAFYDRATSFDEVYPGMVEHLVAAAHEHGHVLYAVPGSPRVAERSVELLAEDTRVDVEVLPALSFLDLAWVRLGLDPLALGVRLVDGQDFATAAAGERGPLLVSHCHRRSVLSDIKLAADGAGDVIVLQRLGLPDEAVTAVAWEDLDRSIEPDHLTSIYIPELAAPVGAELQRFAELVRTLRERCPWDQEQTHASLTRHLLEESYEVLEAIEDLDDEPTAEQYDHLEEELGDLLFQVVFHAALGAEAGRFTLADVARGIHDKLVRRHPHVFAAVEVGGTADVVANWEQIKKEEKGRSSVMDGIPGNLPALLYAAKVVRKAGSIGVDIGEFLPPSPDLPSIEAAASGSDALGTALLALVAAAVQRSLDPEAALRGATGRLRDRARSYERS